MNQIYAVKNEYSAMDSLLYQEYWGINCTFATRMI